MTPRGRTVSYGYGTCRGCGETRAAKKDGTPWPHDIAATTTWGADRRLCPGCIKPMCDIKAPEPNGRSAQMSSQTRVADRRPLPRTKP
jgi:hypothetical protein